MESLRERLPAATYREVAEIIDSAAARGLPAPPLVSKALEGAARKAPAASIIAAVRRLVQQLGVARDALGDDASAEELDAGAIALRAGISPEGLSRLRQARKGRSLTVPLNVMADLVARGVPVPDAFGAVETVARLDVRDDAFATLRSRIVSDIEQGIAPAASAQSRASAFIKPREPDA